MGKSGVERSPGEGREPVGNQNAVKHGFYYKLPIGTEKQEMLSLDINNQIIESLT